MRWIPQQVTDGTTLALRRRNAMVLPIDPLRLERRRHWRYACHLDVEIAWHDLVLIRGVAVNCSLLGAALELPCGAARGEQVNVTVLADRAPWCLSAVVRWSLPIDPVRWRIGVALRFESADEIRRWRSLVHASPIIN
jgi:hypothetical protein